MTRVQPAATAALAAPALALALAFAFGLAPAPAHAQGQGGAAGEEERVAEAKKFFEAGRQAYEAGQYMVAAAAFEEAYRLSPRPPVIFSMAQAYRRQYFVDRDPAKLKRAVDLYREYVRLVPQGGRREDAVTYIAELEPILGRIESEQRSPVMAAPPQRTEVTQLMVSSQTKGVRAAIGDDKFMEVPLIREVAPGTHVIRVKGEGYFPREVEGVAVEGRLVVVEVNLEPRPARLTLRGTRGAELAIDGRHVGEVPRTVEVPAGRHVVTVTRRGHYPMSREVQLERGQEVALDARLETTTQRVAAWWVLGASGVLFLSGGVATTFALVHEGNAQAILDKRDRDRQNLSSEELDEYLRERDARDDLVTASIVLYAGAAALGLMGALLYLVDSPRVEATPGSGGATVVPLATPGGVGAAWMGRF